MLIKITNQCGAGCSHCMEDSTPKAGQHMSDETFSQALAFTKRTEGGAYLYGAPRLLWLGGGEATEHPRFCPFVAEATLQSFVVAVLTNGAWLSDPALRRAFLRPEWPRIRYQVTNDPRFYPKAIERFEDPRLIYIDELPALVPLGRAVGRGRLEGSGVPVMKYPTSFNVRAAVHRALSFSGGVSWLRIRAWEQIKAAARGELRGANLMPGTFTPTVSHEGYVMAGETRSCFRLGTVKSSNVELTLATLEMGECNRCGLEDNLPPAHREAIALPVRRSAAG